METDREEGSATGSPSRGRLPKFTPEPTAERPCQFLVAPWQERSIKRPYQGATRNWHRSSRSL